MADLVNSNNNAQQTQAITALKRGATLLKYGRKGEPKFCLFKLSDDETTLIWTSSTGERYLKLSSVTSIIPGKRTAVFQHYLPPEKEYLSFSLIYNGKRSLGLICKDKVEADLWISGLKALISPGQGGRSKIDGWSDGGLYVDDSQELTSNSPSNSSASGSRDLSSPEVSVSLNPNTYSKSFSCEISMQSGRSHVTSYSRDMQTKVPGPDAFRVSVSSAPSTSSHGSALDDCDAMGDVYIWGEVMCDNVLKLEADNIASCGGTRSNVLVPKPLESYLVLDVQHISCGVRHAALVTRQGEVFTWGEESGGRLGHGVGQDVTQPCLVESLSSACVDIVACGEFHTCAVTISGELYTWGDGMRNSGLLGHDSDVSHWIPKRILGLLEGLQVASVTCGPWHTALVTSTGQLFTFGDGTFGVLGHGDRQNVAHPREVESLSGLRTIAVACGVWHTAAVVEVIVTQSSASGSSGKLFTWGDGDKNRLGQGDKDPRLKPTCVPALIDYNFQKVACGHSLTVGLTTSGRIFTMGSTVYGQLGNPLSDGKQPCLVQDKLAGEIVDEIASGAYHVAALTTKNEVYTWGKGANGRLGHGDTEDRKSPTLVEALKDRHVRYLACGSNYTVAICLHKWVSGAEQSQCAACKQAFGFTRKRHNCYNCGLVHCHSCSSKKATRAALAPSPSKPYRVCDSCYVKLNKISESGYNHRRNAIPRHLGENKEKLDKMGLAKSPVPSNMDLIKQLDSKAAKQGKKADTSSLVPSLQTPSLLQLKDVYFSSNVDVRQIAPRPILAPSGMSSRSVSPLSRRPSPPRSATPFPTTAGLSFSKSVADNLKRTNELLSQELQKLRAQVASLKQRCAVQDIELQKSEKKVQEALQLASDESAKSKSAKEVIKSLTAQLKEMAEKLPAGAYNTEDLNIATLQNGFDTNGNSYPETDEEHHLRSDSVTSTHLASSTDTCTTEIETRGSYPGTIDTNTCQSNEGCPISNGTDTNQDVRLSNSNGAFQATDLSESGDSKEPVQLHDGHRSTRSRNPAFLDSADYVEAEWIEQYEPGVYITLVALRDGSRDLKRVRFSRRRFGENQAETWWSENRDKVYERYNVNESDRSSLSGQNASR